MHVRQYAYFAFRSESVSAATITARLGIEPDEIQVRGSRISEPPRPVCHAWEVKCDRPGLRIDEQLAAIVRRLTPHLDAIAALAIELRAADTGAAVLEVVRYFNSGEGEDDGDLIIDGIRIQHLSGQHQLLGWTLDADVLDLLHRTGATLDVDEYG